MGYRHERGSIGIVVMFCFALAFIVSIAVVNSYRELRYSRDAQRSCVAYHAAEGGVTHAAARIAKGGGVKRETGRLGDGYYEVKVSKKGEGYRIISRGYYYPRKVKNLGPTLTKLRKGSGYYKNTVVVEGEVKAGRFKTNHRSKSP